MPPRRTALVVAALVASAILGFVLLTPVLGRLLARLAMPELSPR